MLPLFFEQAANGLQFGLMLFLIAAGLTLVFGIMDTINLAHGSLYMVGAYLGAHAAATTGSFLLGLFTATLGVAAIGALLELFVFRRLYARDHLDQVLVTFGLILIANESVRWLWGDRPLPLDAPSAFAGPVEFHGFSYPAYRLLLIFVGLTLAALLFALLKFTRFGMWVRAGAANRPMTEAMGVAVPRLFFVLFVVGAALSAFAGYLLAPLSAVQPGMGENILILAFVVIVIGGIGSIRGALVASLLVGVVDTLGRALLPELLRTLTNAQLASHLGPTLASMSIYLLMAAVLYFRPQGLLPTRL
ncbi:MAG: branched-chain amino acid ABC transporter permease [Rhodocyclaceae bacterium]|nr:branched-chain amino acid ABC transporter permease [Rhodocyclaceae bacterium]